MEEYKPKYGNTAAPQDSLTCLLNNSINSSNPINSNKAFNPSIGASWNTPPAQLLLPRHDVHIWRAALGLSSKRVQELKVSLSIDERMKAGDFRFERDRSQFIAARGILRLILSCYLSVEPGAIRFCYEEDGKLRLENAPGKTGIQFNLSHSGGLALYVFARGHKVGVDLERIRDLPEMEQMVEQFFSVRERLVFATLPTSEKHEPFYKWWTRKEALMKAIGEGLSYPLDRFDALLTDGKSVELTGILGDAQEGPKWSMWDLRLGKAFAGAVVVERGDWDVHVQCWQWPDEIEDYVEKMTSYLHSSKVNI